MENIDNEIEKIKKGTPERKKDFSNKFITFILNLIKFFQNNNEITFPKIKELFNNFLLSIKVSETPNSSNETPNSSNETIDGNYLLELLEKEIQKLISGDLKEEEIKDIKKKLNSIEEEVNSKDDLIDSKILKKIIKFLNISNKLYNNKILEKDELALAKATFGSSEGNRTYTQNPRIPNIAQFKPTGTSNIFSPIIEVKNSPMRNNNNKRYSNAYEKGFEKGLTKAQNTLGTANIIDQSTQITDTTVTKGDTTEIQGNITKYGNSSKQKGENNTEMGKKSSVGNGYIKGDNNGILQKPGYSYLDPNLWDVPRKRAPICYSKGDMERKENSLDPAGFVFGGPSNVMEFHGVGSIMPKFSYEENVTEVETPGDL